MTLHERVKNLRETFQTMENYEIAQELAEIEAAVKRIPKRITKLLNEDI